MREFKILVIVVVVISVIYWGVEPLAHSIMHPQVSSANYDFAESNKDDIVALKSAIKEAKASLEKAKSSGDKSLIALASATLAKYEMNLANLENFWNPIDLSLGEVRIGQILVEQQCLACHTINSQNLARSSGQSDEETARAYGVLPPDLSNSAAVIDKAFLAHFIKNPTLASKLWHRDDFYHPMPSYNFYSNQEIADIVVYLESIAPKNLSDKEVFEQACARCHSVDYDHLTAQTSAGDLERYLGTQVPDLSMMIRSRGADYLHKFINDPQKLLAGTAMPRVGVTKQAEEQIITYLESVGDSKKNQRESLGIKIIAFFAIMAILSYLWKRKIWKDLH